MNKYKYVRLMRLATRTYVNYKLRRPMDRKIDCQRAVEMLFPKNWTILAYYKCESDLPAGPDSEGDKK